MTGPVQLNSNIYIYIKGKIFNINIVSFQCYSFMSKLITNGKKDLLIKGYKPL